MYLSQQRHRCCRVIQSISGSKQKPQYCRQWRVLQHSQHAGVLVELIFDFRAPAADEVLLKRYLLPANLTGPHRHCVKATAATLTRLGISITAFTMSGAPSLGERSCL